MRKAFAFVLAILTIVLVSGSIYLAIRLQQDQAPDDSGAASEEVVKADTLKTQAQRNAFAAKWKAIIDNKANGFDEYLQFALGEGARYECKTKIMDKVGKEALYGCDLNVAFLIHDFPHYISTGVIGPQDPRLNAVLDEMITASGMLQVAEREKMITLNSTYFNNPDKDQQKRLDVLVEIRPKVEDKFIKKMDFEMVIIYFHDQIPTGKVTQAKARQVAEAKINNLYKRIKAGKITMRQAGREIENDRIKGDTTGVPMRFLDPLYKSNAYTMIKGHHYMDRAFIDPDWEVELRSLGEGQISTVRLFKDFDFTSDPDRSFYYEPGKPDLPMIESGFVIFKLNKIDFGYSEEFEIEDAEALEKEIAKEFEKDAQINLK